ncbi:MAG: TonB-dependent receptor plug domain-containing protein, partial [Acidobacteriota bacterium]
MPRENFSPFLIALLVALVNAPSVADTPPGDAPPESFGEAIVVTATRTEKRLLDVPVPVRQVSREAIDASAARTLADAIELTPGVRIESNCQNCNFSQVRLLGLEGPYTQILVDGQPTVSSLALVYGIEQFPARLLD